MANCDTYIYMGSNDVDTAKAVCLRCNKPLEQILYMPVGKCWVFERGKKPVYANILPMPNNELIEQKNREHKHNDMEVQGSVEINATFKVGVVPAYCFLVKLAELRNTQ